jgi:photosystem II stability/assembly factor-like uncharacterized protein
MNSRFQFWAAGREAFKVKVMPASVFVAVGILILISSVAAPARASMQGGRRILLSSPARIDRVQRPLKRRRALPRRQKSKSSFRTVVEARANMKMLAEQAIRTEQDGTHEDPNWRLNWFLFQRTYPFDTLPSQGRFNAFGNAIAANQAAPQPTLPSLTERWRPVGPTSIQPKFPSMGLTSGRISAIAISPADPQLVIVGGATGGIWRSIDGGTTFVPVSDDQVDLAVGSIAFSPSNPAIVYAGMGDVAGGYMGTGVLKSTNSGQIWARISDDTLPAPGTIANIIVEPSDPNRVYITQYSYRAATGEGEVYASGFFLSEDGGKRWHKTLTGLPRDLAHHPSSPQTLYLSMSTTFSASPPSAGVYKSGDGGMTWKPVLAPNYLCATDIKLAVAPSEADTLYVLTGLVTKDTADVKLLITKDGGSSWADVGISDLDIGQFGYNTYVAVDPTNAQTIYVGTRDLYKSTNGGADWINLTKNWQRFSDGYSFSPSEAVAHSDQHVLVFAPMSPNVIYIGTDGGLSRSSDGGETFVSLNRTLSLTQFNSITLHPTDITKSCGGSQDNGALIRVPAGNQWTEFVSGDSGRCLMNPLDPAVLYSSYIFGVIYRSRNNGSQTEGAITNNSRFDEPFDEPRIGFYPAFAINESNGRLYFGTWRLFTSDDQGNNWVRSEDASDLTKGITSFGADVLTAIGIGPRGSNVLYTGSAQGRVMRSLNGGKNWTDVTRGLPNRFITSIKVDSADANRVYVTVSGFSSAHVLLTSDGGKTWENISISLPNIPVNAIQLDPLNSNTLYAGTDVGVYRSLDNGKNWHRFNVGLPPAVVTGFSSQSVGLIQVATYGRGAYELVR